MTGPEDLDLLRALLAEAGIALSPGDEAEFLEIWRQNRERTDLLRRLPRPGGHWPIETLRNAH